MGNNRFEELRCKYSNFNYNNYHYNINDDGIDFSFDFSIDGLSSFNPTWHIDIINQCGMGASPKQAIAVTNYASPKQAIVVTNCASPKQAIAVTNCASPIQNTVGASYASPIKKIDELVFNIGMVEAISYWKLTCAKNINIKCHNLSENNILWWKKLYINGLGEFFYRNGIKFDDTMFDIKCMLDGENNLNFKQEPVEVSYRGPIQNSVGVSYASPMGSSIQNVLIPIGGGKDSAVTIELLKDIANRYCYIINPRRATLDTFTQSGITNDKLIIANRTLDTNMLKLNNEGFLNGHTPFSALVAFSSVLAAYLNGISEVALSNESSANESTVLGMDVNHQYSKTYEFENDFRQYEKENINTSVSYFSILRPITEVAIAKLFSRFSKYHNIFRSCNEGSKKDIWCCKCPKCLFVFTILSPFMSFNRLCEIFGKNLFDDELLIPIFDKLIGKTKEKPFECVGSREEVNACIQNVINDMTNNNVKLPKLLEYYKSLDMPNVKSINDIYHNIDEHNFVKEEYLNKILELLSN